jgi:hypothetical protein
LAVNDQSPMGRRRTPRRSAAGYQPVRQPKLRAPVVTQPPPLPEPPEAPPFAFGNAEEDGLRILAALETMESLEPDFCGDLVTEASVTIIERAELTAEPEQEAEPPPAGSLRARLGDIGDAPDIDPEEHAAYQGDVEEATVEIVEVASTAALAVAAEPALLPTPLRTAHQARRFLKALIGGEDE